MSQWIVIGYPELGWSKKSNDDKRLMICESKKSVVGAVGLLLDHFEVAHIDIMRDETQGNHKITEYVKRKTDVI